MKEALSEFDASLNDIRWFIKSVELQSTFIQTDFAAENPYWEHATVREYRAHLATHTLVTRQFAYNTVIVSLYGALERCVEETISQYLDALKSICPLVNDLPETIRTNHVRLSFELLNKIEKTPFRDSLPPTSAIANLYKCQSNSVPYDLNWQAFVYHTANFRAETINESFGRIGVDDLNRKVIHREEFIEYFQSFDPPRDVDKSVISDILAMLDQLADRRNEASHGRVDSLLSLEELRSYLDFIELYVHCMWQVVYESLLPFKIRHQALRLEPVIKVFRAHVVCFPFESGSVSVGDLLLAETNDKIRYGNILEIQVDGTSFQSVVGKKGLQIGMLVPFNAKISYMYHLVPRPRILDQEATTAHEEYDWEDDSALVDEPLGADEAEV